MSGHLCMISPRRLAIRSSPVPFHCAGIAFASACSNGFLHWCLSLPRRIRIPYLRESWVRRSSMGGRPASFNRKPIAVHLSSLVMMRVIVLYTGSICDRIWAAPVQQISEPPIIIGITVEVAKWWRTPGQEPFRLVIRQRSRDALLVAVEAAVAWALKLKWWLMWALGLLSFLSVRSGCHVV